MDLRVNKRYQLVKRIGSGGHGDVYEGLDTVTGEPVAIKLERGTVDPSLLEAESEMYRSLRCSPGIPSVYWFGYEGDFRALVFELLGPNLEDLFCFCDRKFSLKTVLMIAEQAIVRLQHLHAKGIVHRDIKPENMMMGTGRKGSTLYLSDLGIAFGEGFCDIKTGAWRTAHGLLGSALCASVTGHLGIAQSPRDDLEALGYMLVYLLKGRLPWQELAADDTMMNAKKNISIDELCKDLPAAFSGYFKHLRSLKSGELPNHTQLRRSYLKLFRERGFENDRVFDWTKILFEKQFV